MIRAAITVFVVLMLGATWLLSEGGCTPADSQVVAYAAARHDCVAQNDAAAPARACLQSVDKQFGQYDGGDQ